MQNPFSDPAFPPIVWTANVDGVITGINQFWYDYSGLTQLPFDQESIDRGFRQALHPDDRDRVLTQWQSIISQSEPVQTELRLRQGNGTYHWFATQITPVAAEDGAIQQWVGTCVGVDPQKAEPQKTDPQKTDPQKTDPQKTDITREETIRLNSESVQALRQSEERYRSLVLAISQIIWNTNADGRVETAMPSWSAYTGQSEVEIQGLGWLEAIHPADRDQTVQALNQAIQSKTLYKTEYRLCRVDGSYQTFSTRGIPVLQADGSIREWIGICTDITEQKQIEARATELARITNILTHTTANLERRNQELDQFAYVVSHDLKAPLRAIANLSEWIEEDLHDCLTEDTRHQMNLLRGRVHRMENLIDGLLQYSRIGRTDTVQEAVAVDALLQDVIDSLAPPAEFTLKIQAGMPTVQTNRLRLEQVFANLINNAIKHHDRPSGQIQITVHDRGSDYEFSVSDDGPGIAPEYHHKIFGIFQTLEARDKVENTGIGLSIVKKIVENNGGTIWLESQPGKGAKFMFTWLK